MSDPNLPDGVTQSDIDKTVGETFDPIKDEIHYGMEGDQHTAFRNDFIDLANSLCGFGDTQEDALQDLLYQENDAGER